MEYNTTRNHLILPEYGRNVQNMIAHAKKLEDRSERNRAVQAIIEVMGQLNPHLRDVDDYRHKLWTHLFVMANFDLDVDTPYEIPKPEVLNEKPEWMEYPKSNIKYGHYGKYTPMILETAKTTEDPNEKEYLKNSMANFMKKQYLSHNNDAVENNVIAGHLKELSEGELILDNPDDLMNTNTILRSMGIGINNKQKFSKKTNFKQKQNQNQNQKQKFKKQ
jgi:hypothetical protein